MANVFKYRMNDPRGRSRSAAKAKAVHNVPVRFVVENSWEMVMTLPTSDGKLLNITLDRHDIKSLKTALGVS